MDPELKRVIENVQRLVAMGAPQADIEGYARSEGYELADLNRAATQAPPDPGLVEIERPGGLRGALSTALQGATLGFGDEIGAAIRAAPRLVPGGQSFGQAYAENVEAAREGLAATREDRPVTSLLTEGAGIVGTALGTGGSALLARPIVGGAVLGAAAGVGSAEGGLKQRVAGGVSGGVAGGVGGGLASAAGRVLRPVASPLLDLLRPTAGRLGGLVQSTADRAAGKVQGALQRAGVDPTRLVREAVPGETLLDVGGESVRKLGRAAEAIPSQGADDIRRALTERASRAPSRIKEALQKKTGLTFEDAVATVDDLASTKAANAAPLYEAAYEKAVPASLVEDALKLPAFRDAYERGLRIAQTEGTPLPALTDDIAEMADIPVQAIDYMKRGLDDLIESRQRGGAMGRTEARALRNRLRGVLEDVDDAVPEYGAARASYAGDSAVQEAFEAGLEDFSKNADPRTVARKIQEMTPSERDFYRRGALDALRSKLESVTDFGRNPDVTRQLVGNQELRDRVRQLFDTEEAFEQFMDVMRREQEMVATRSFVLGGSPTTRIQEDVADLRGGAQGFRLSDLTRPIEGGRRMLDDVVAARYQTGGERVVNELAPLLTTDLFSGGGTLLERLARFNQREAQRRALVQAGPRAASIAAGLLAPR